jgi:hypothetical protein
VRVAFVVALLLMSLPARADRRETYVVLGFDPGVARYELGPTGSGAAAKPSGTFSATGYYGLTNEWHMGGRLRLSRTTNLDVSNAVVALNGVKTVGDVYEDHLGIGLGAVLLYRVSTDHPLAPLIEIEGGFTNHSFSRVAFIPKGSTYSYPQSSVSYVALYGAAGVLLEYRFLTRWLAAVGVSVQRESGQVPWGVSIPLRVGVVWWR